jgi:uncharacterized surface protein with fasciclin (FAS1) repeats
MRNIALIISTVALIAAPTFIEASNCSGGHADAKQASVTPDIVDTAVAAGSFNTLVAAVKAAGLVDVLKGDGPYTVFAPTDTAFENLPEGALQSLLDNPEQLKQVLLYHVVPGNVKAEQVVKLNSATTAQGSDVQIKVADGSVMIDNAKVVTPDIETSNGTIHVIDTVILPAS